MTFGIAEFLQGICVRSRASYIPHHSNCPSVFEEQIMSAIRSNPLLKARQTQNARTNSTNTEKYYCPMR